MLKRISRCLPEAAGNISPSLVCSRGHSPAIHNRRYHVSWQERVQGTPSSATHLPHLCQEQVFCLAPAAPSPLQLCCSGSRAQQGPGVPPRVRGATCRTPDKLLFSAVGFVCSTEQQGQACSSLPLLPTNP